ncbi:MAG: GNAT family N-acetyltransferase [Moraxellaceae bacterium]|nr:GNAT family N-acetyltransferase [Moraxellaceae bacterium]
MRACTREDLPRWLVLRQALWPAEADEHLGEMSSFLDEPERFAQFLALDVDGKVLGLVEAALRHDYVNGTDSSPVAFLEGLYVAPDARRQGVAVGLVAAVEDWARERGCHELASDAALGNVTSHATHCALGFEETERVVYFRKHLAKGAG